MESWSGTVKQRFLYRGGDPMIRFLMFILVLILALGIAVLTGFAVHEAVIIFVLATLSLNFLGWIIQGFRPNLLRCLFFWWIAQLFDKQEWLFPD
jgi:hypothetical protein